MDNKEDIRNILERFNSTPRWFDKDGIPILDIGKVEQLLRDDTYKIVSQELIGDYLVSTVWLGLNHSYWKNLPILIFETMIFYQKEAHDELTSFQVRYSTLQEAIEGHKKACDLARILNAMNQ